MDNEAIRWLSKLLHHYVDKLGVRDRRRRLGGHMSQKSFYMELNIVFWVSELGEFNLAAGESAPRTSVEPNSHGDLFTNGPDSR